MTQEKGQTGPVGSSDRPASGGPEIWNVVAWGDVRECRSVSSVMEEVREAVELGCRTISIERQGAHNNPASGAAQRLVQQFSRNHNP